MSLLGFLSSSFEQAKLRIVEPATGDDTINLRFNPADYKIRKENSFAEIPVPGTQAPPLQYIRGGARVLSVDVLVDTTGTYNALLSKFKSVEKEYVSKVAALLDQNDKLHAPPTIAFVWGEQSFQGVLQSLETQYLLFHTDGLPLRAKLSLVIKEHDPAKVSVKANSLLSPDVEKRYVVRAGESLSSIAASVFLDPAKWREIAVANGITDPRTVAPGTVLTVPRLEAPRR